MTAEYFLWWTKGVNILIHFIKQISIFKEYRSLIWNHFRLNDSNTPRCCFFKQLLCTYFGMLPPCNITKLMLSIGKMNQVPPLSAIINMILLIILVNSYCFLCRADWKCT